MNDSPFDSFVFTHIPKCGGTSLRRYIYKAAVNSDIPINSIHIPGEGDQHYATNLLQLDQNEFSKVTRNNIKILADHTKLDPQMHHKLGLKKPYIFTLFRNPFDRFISHYNFFFKKIGNAGFKNRNIEDLNDTELLSVVKKLSNIQTGYILGLGPGLKTLDKIESRFHEIPSLLNNRLSSFGILEDMEKTLFILNKTAPNWITFHEEFPKANSNKYQHEFLNKSEAKKIFNKYNAYDLCLYQLAKGLFMINYLNLKNKVN